MSHDRDHTWAEVGPVAGTVLFTAVIVITGSTALSLALTESALRGTAAASTALLVVVSLAAAVPLALRMRRRARDARRDGERHDDEPT